MTIATRIHETCFIHPIEDTARTGNDLYLLRDDLLPFGLGGNKVRIALAFVEDMQARGKNAMIAYGSSNSNMCRVISNMCYALGFPCTVVLSDAGSMGTNCSNKHLMDLYGAHVITCTSDGIAAAIQKAFDRYIDQGLDPYYIFGNTLGQGNEHVAARAYAAIYPQLMTTVSAKPVPFDHVFCASGTQSTQSGLIVGHLLANDATHVHGIMISSRSTPRAHQAIVTAVHELLKEQNRTDLADAIEPAIHLIDDKRRGGYGAYGTDVLKAIADQLRTNGVPFDPVYTGKAFLGMQEYLLESGVTGQRVLFVHTGGEPIFYDTLAAGALNAPTVS